MSADKYRTLLEQHRHEIKPEAVDEIERGMALTAADVTRAMTLHGQLLQRMAAFFERYDIIACAVSQVPPFDVNADWPRSIAAVDMTTYTDWMKSAYWISVTLGPAISRPMRLHTRGATGGHSTGRTAAPRSRIAPARVWVRTGHEDRRESTPTLPDVHGRNPPLWRLLSS